MFSCSDPQHSVMYLLRAKEKADKEADKERRRERKKEKKDKKAKRHRRKYEDMVDAWVDTDFNADYLGSFEVRRRSSFPRLTAFSSLWPRGRRAV